MFARRTIAALLLGISPLATVAQSAEWKSAKGPLMTRWAKDVSPDNVHPEYPRPQLVRAQWQNLNGLWELATVGERLDTPPKDFGRQILVPFPIESALSGVMDRTSHAWYRRSFDVPDNWHGKQVLLNFGAVDWEATVWVNGKELGTHRGGYDAFSFDVTDALKSSGHQELVVRVFDPTTSGSQPRGKQSEHPGGIFYTPTTGIWQTVWLEPVSPAYIENLELEPDLDASALRLLAAGSGTEDGDTVEAIVSEGRNEVARASGKIGGQFSVAIPQAKSWSSDNPFLYNLEVIVSRDGKVLDRVESYFGLRKIALLANSQGLQRIALNGKPLFLVGPLDQGFWPDGLYTAPSDDALRNDVEMTKKFGFNCSRKHVKVEPDRWYYWCDKLGILVWQDMPSGDNKDDEAHKQFETELERMIAGRRNHPSIVQWVLFNEGWGEFDTKRLTQRIQELDPRRLVTDASGWTDVGVGSVMDIHIYPGPAAPTADTTRATVLGEFGGLGLKVDGHMWETKNWGYQNTKDRDELTSRYESLWQDAWELHKLQNLSAAIYTQLTDVETESNGLMTYDRSVVKVDLAKAKAAALGRFPQQNPLAATSEHSPQSWHFIIDQPTDAWKEVDFNDSDWQQGPGGFGSQGTPGAVIGTPWKTADIWLRRHFDLPSAPKGALALRMHHDEGAEVFINGTLITEQENYTTGYYLLRLDDLAQAAVKTGDNVLAVHCHQNVGGQFIDVGLIELVDNPEQIEIPWNSLFDGKTLGKWQPSKFGGQGGVEVEDGEIVLSFGSEMTGITWSGEAPKMNYELELEARRIDGSDFFCGLTFPVGESPCSFIVGGWGGGVVGLSSLDGKDAAHNNTTKYMAFQKKRWYAIRIRVTENKIETWIDNEKMVDADTTGKKISIRAEVEPSRPLGISSYATTAGLRNIRWRPLAPVAAKSTDVKP